MKERDDEHCELADLYVSGWGGALVQLVSVIKIFGRPVQLVSDLGNFGQCVSVLRHLGNFVVNVSVACAHGVQRL